MHLFLMLILSVSYVLAQHDDSLDIDHLVPISNDAHIDDSLLEYDVKLKSTLIHKLPKFPRAFALITGGMGGTESCVTLYKNKSDEYFIETRKMERSLWYDKLKKENKVFKYTKQIDNKKALEIAQLWKTMLLEVKCPKPNPKRGKWTDVIMIYYAAYINDLGIAAGETPNPAKKGANLDKISDMTRWMIQYSMGDQYLNPSRLPKQK